MSTTQFACVLLGAGAALLVGCSASGGPSAGGNAGTNSGTSANNSRSELASDKGSAQLWTENCSRCHNVRSPDYYTPGRWALVTQHMRVRGYLTGEEERQIAAFLQSQ